MDLPPPPPCGGAVHRESVRGYIPMTKNRDSTCSSSNDSPRASHYIDEDIYDCPPPAKARFPELPEEAPPPLPTKKNPSRKVKPGLPPNRQNSSFRQSPLLEPPMERQGSVSKPTPKPRASIQKQKPVPAPRKKNSIKISGVTVDSSEDTYVGDPTTENQAETEDVYEEMSRVSMDTSMDTSKDVSLPATSSSIESLDVSDVVPINWAGGGCENVDGKSERISDNGESDTIDKTKDKTVDELDVGVPPPPLTPQVQAVDDEYVAPDLGERPPSGGCEGEPHPPSPPPHKAEENTSILDTKPETTEDESIMVDNEIYDNAPVFPQPEGRVVIGAELTAEEVENMANESAERAPGRLGAYGGTDLNSSTGTGSSLSISSPHDSCYGSIWDMKSGKRSGIESENNNDKTPKQSTSSEDSLALLGDAPPPPSFPPPNPPVAPRAKPPRPTLDSPIPFQAAKKKVDDDTPGSRDSFNEPPPNFSPPPLPPALATFQEPPFLPPRPCQSKGSVIRKAPVLSPSPLQKSQSLDFLDMPTTTAPTQPPLHPGDYITAKGPRTDSPVEYSVITKPKHDKVCHLSCSLSVFGSMWISG